MLTVLKLNGQWAYCRCDCGKEKNVRKYDLPRTKSCGCARIKSNLARTKHGHSRRSGMSPTYRSWADMTKRCTNPKNWAWKYYGARGIKICERWLSFENFLSDMGERPKALTLDRINNDGNYEPGNCKWSTRKEQSINRRMPFRLSEKGR